MRFKEFMEGSSEFDLTRFKTDCAFYLEQIKNAPNNRSKYLLHGDKRSPSNYVVRSFHERISPRDTDRAFHDSANSFFERKFGKPWRNGLFTTGFYQTAQTFGGVSVIFPIGKFEWLYSPDIFDFTEWSENQIKDARKQMKEPLGGDTRSLSIKAAVNLDNVRWEHNKDLPEGLNTKHEVIIWCDKYYQFNYESRAFNDEVSIYVDGL